MRAAATPIEPSKTAEVGILRKFTSINERWYWSSTNADEPLYLSRFAVRAHWNSISPDSSGADYGVFSLDDGEFAPNFTAASPDFPGQTFHEP
jgi:hypothetical protein